ncbi:papilin-like, partial [Nothobranchius furzeri]
VPSVQDPGSGSTMRRFEPHVSGETSVSYTSAPRCAQSSHGCCPDGYTSASGPRNQGCSPTDCTRTRYGCCLDGVTPAPGVGRAGCPEHQTADEHPSHPVDSSLANSCFLPRDEGPCDTWVVRFSYDSGTGKCKEFWYGGCHGNANNFMSMEACRRGCGGVGREPASLSVTRRRGSLGTIARATAHRSRLQHRA